MSRRLPILALFLALFFTPLVTGAIQVPEYTGYVTDLAGVIPPREKAEITAIVEKVNRDTGAEIAVLTVLTTGSEGIFDYAMAVAEDWKPGQKGKDNGIVIVVATEDHKIRVQIGYGLEGVINDGKAGEVISETMVPSFQNSDYGTGILKGVMAIAEIIDPGSVKGAAEPITLAPPTAPMPSNRLSTFDLIKILLIVAVFLYLAIRHPRLLLLLILMGGGGGRRGRGSFGGGGGFSGFGGGGFGGGGAGRSW